MLIVKRGYRRKYVHGGSGLFDSVANFFKGLLSSNVGKQLLDVGKTAGKEAAIVAGKKLAEKGMDKILAPKSQTALQAPLQASLQALTPESQAIIDKYSVMHPQTELHVKTQNVNSLIDGSGRANAIAIQDLVKRLNGSGLKCI